MNDPRNPNGAGDIRTARQSDDDPDRSALAEKHGSIGSWLWDPATEKFSWSEQVYRLLGLDPDAAEAGFKATCGVLHPDDRTKTVARFDEVMRARDGSFAAQYRVIWPDGESRVLLDTGQFVPDPGSGRPLLVGTLRDITDEPASERENRRFKASLDATRDAVFMNDAETLQYFYVNEAAVRHTGYSRDELLAMNTLDLNPDMSKEKIDQFVTELDAGAAEYFSRIGYHRHKAGHLVPVESQTQLVRTAGESPMFITIARDITLRRERQAEIEQFKSTLDQVNDRVFIYDPETLRFKYGNESASKALGYTFDELAELKPSDINVSDSEDEIRAIIEDLRTGQITGNVREVQHRRKDGSRTPVELSMQYLHPPGEEPRIVTVARDITDRIKARAAAERQQHELERLVKERTDALQEAQIELIKQERLSTLGRLTATVSHELRNPLATIRPALFVLRTLVGDGDTQVRGLLDRIERNIQRCDRIIDELLDFTRHRELQLETITADSCIREVVQDLQIPEGVSFSLSLKAADTSIEVDVEALRRAILNILDNALHAVAEKHNGDIDGYEPEVRLGTRAKQGGRIEIVVQDNGLGMSTEVRQRLFEPLFSTKGFGVGLGTTIVRNIMQLHEGGIEIDSEAGIGTTITLWLPARGHKLDSRKN